MVPAAITGAALAAIAVTILPDLLKPFRDRYHIEDVYIQVIFALSLVILIVVRPQGVFGPGELTYPGKRRDRQREYLEADTQQPVSHRPPPKIGQTVLDAVNLTRRFGGLTAVGNVNIRLDQGELVGLIGPNGAGKTTLFNLLTGVYEPSDGQINFLGESLAGIIPNPSNKRTARLALDCALYTLGGWIAGTILATVLVPNAATPADAHIQVAVRWGRVLAASGIGLLITAPRKHKNLAGPKPYQFARRGICRTFQNIRLFWRTNSTGECAGVGTYLRRKTNLFDALLHTPRLGREQEAETLLLRGSYLRDLTPDPI